MQTPTPSPADPNAPVEAASAALSRVRRGWLLAGLVPLGLGAYIAWHEIRMARLWFEDWAIAGGAAVLGTVLLAVGLRSWMDRALLILVATGAAAMVWHQATRAFQTVQDEVAGRQEVRDALLTLAPVCTTGTGEASAAAYTPGQPNIVLRILSSPTRPEPTPIGAFDPTGERELLDPSGVSLVACWEMATTTTAVCPYRIPRSRAVREHFVASNQTHTRTEQLPDGQGTFDRTQTATTVTLREARTGRVLHTMFDPGTDPGPCPATMPYTEHHSQAHGAALSRADADAAVLDWARGERALP